MPVERITGLASGMDIDTTVKKLMTAERVPVDNLTKKKQIAEWQREDYRSLNSKFLEFKNSMYSMKLEASTQVKKVAVTDETYFSASATGLANEGNYSLKVNQLASTANQMSSATLGLKGDTSKTLSSVVSGLSSDFTLQLVGEKGTESITVKPSGKVSDLISAINAKSTTTGIKVSYDTTLDRIQLTSTGTGAKSSIQFDAAASDRTQLNSLWAGLGFSSQGQLSRGSQSFASGETTTLSQAGTLSVSIDGTSTKTISIASGTTKVSDVISSINSDADFQKNGISAHLDKDNQLVISKSNSLTTIGITADNASILTELGLDASPTFTSALRTSGTNAKVAYNGVNVEYTSNNFVVNGLNVSLKKANQSSDAATQMSVVYDSDAIFNNIKNFVTKFNDLNDALISKTSEDRYKEYQPLSDDQKAAMSETQITKWEEKAKSGLLRNDSIISKIQVDLRRAMSGSVTGISSTAVNQLSLIGVKSLTFADNGRLSLDETKLKEAIAASPDAITTMFTKYSGSATSSTGDGIARRVYDQMTTAISLVSQKAGTSGAIVDKSMMSDEITRYKTQISTLSSKMADKESAYYKKFGAMEKAMQKYNNQASYFQSQVSKM